MDELPAPVTTPMSTSAAPLAFRQDGKIADRETARELGRRGGLAKARRVRLVDSLGLADIAEQSTFKPYRDAGEEFVKHHVSQLSLQAGGEVGAAPSSIIASAGLQLAASRWAFDLGAQTNHPALMKLGSQLANDSRQNLLAAYELAVREAQAREQKRPASPPWAGGDT